MDINAENNPTLDYAKAKTEREPGLFWRVFLKRAFDILASLLGLLLLWPLFAVIALSIKRDHLARYSIKPPV